MDTLIFKRVLTLAIVVLAVATQAVAQNKDVDKGKEMLKKAMEQKDAAKRQEGITKARESFTKGGLKPQEIGVILGDAYLEAGDLANATNSYNSANKEDKKEGLKKVADAYVEQAFAGEEKNLAKTLQKAMGLYGKAEATKEGARGIGDKFYEKGPDFYDKAIPYYIQGGSEVKVEQIAKEYYDKGGDNQDKAAEVYLKMKSKEGYKKGGDIYYERKLYGKAIDAYLAGGVGEGIQKYADYLYSENRNQEAEELILKLADAYSEKKDDEGLEKLGKDAMAKGSFLLASKIYDKAGNVAMADKCRAYDALVSLKLEEAKSLFTSVGDAAAAKMIADNEKVLIPLRDVGENFDELMKLAPPVNLIMDSASGKSLPSQSDQKLVEDYYKSILAQVYGNVVTVSTNYAKLNSEELKKYIRLRFKKYGAVRNILDQQTFTLKKQKNEVKVKDVVL